MLKCKNGYVTSYENCAENRRLNDFTLGLWTYVWDPLTKTVTNGSDGGTAGLLCTWSTSQIFLAEAAADIMDVD